MRRIVLLLIALMVMASSATAHSARFFGLQPYGDEGWQIGLWRGDGIIAGDPVRAAIVDAQGHLQAASPLSMALRIDCAPSADCRVHDRTVGRIYRPDPEHFEQRDLILTEGIAPDYPEHLDDASGNTLEDGFGFTARGMSAAEWIAVEAANVLANPRASLFAAAFWILLLTMMALAWPPRAKPGRWGLWFVIRFLIFIGLAAFGSLAALYALFLGTPIGGLLGTLLIAALVASTFLVWHRRSGRPR